MKEFFETTYAKVEMCCEDMEYALTVTRPIRFIRQFGKAEVQISIAQTHWKPIYYCPYCGVKFNIIDDPKARLTIDIESARGKIVFGHVGYGKSRHWPKLGIDDIVVVDHFDLIDTKTSEKREFDNTKIKDFAEFMRRFHRPNHDPIDPIEPMKAQADETEEKKPQVKNPFIKAKSEPWRRRGK